MKRTRNGDVIEHQQTLENQIGVSDHSRLTDLPAALLLDILFRLPINSIMKLKLVCVVLHKLISHPDFVLNYTHNSPFTTLLVPGTNPGFDPYIYMDFNLLQISNDDNFHEFFVTKFSPKLPDNRASSFFLAGNCNGLLCLSILRPRYELVYICNPVIGECIKLPERKLKGPNFYPLLAFGFCSSINHYKLLRIVYNSVIEQGIERVGVLQEGEILTVGVDDKWRHLGNTKIPFCSFYKDFSFLAFNGALHWVVLDYGFTWISTFDLGEEKTGQLSYPSGLELNVSSTKLMSRNNELCLTHFSGHEIALWEMKDYGVAESWTKDMVIDISFIPNPRCSWLDLVTVLQNGHFVFSSGSGDYLISWDPIKRKVSQIQAQCFQGITYAPSFLSLNKAVTGSFVYSSGMMSRGRMSSLMRILEVLGHYPKT